ncbi:hypothetical protein L6452_33450 [Arctium lappa]|uniref:Uncharacterized protein n=1 Tax=Arctium lappa TaxID=4217 RepID=A0ACB8YG15_ARCLA|nr:hypothetical protein L6452_33450 [Arctium lappa]
MKRGKIAGKALHNLFFHHHHLAATTTTIHHHLSFPTTPSSTDSEFSCTTTPTHPLTDIKHRRLAVQNLPPATVELRITDSPFPVSDGGGGGEVDEAAEMFIMRFYNDLRGGN